MTSTRGKTPDGLLRSGTGRGIETAMWQMKIDEAVKAHLMSFVFYR